ncbi:family 43 glycosylhydrolase [Brachybacterium sp. J153]|uniref:family 43 glycosylhydrolase n=1 Tax=Brachybacterium sp. J153 TaxID=3116488 RepID=UPI002E79D835|nr:family 43 glycosylhydrolase [Brachybacterium sp. J153]MEE1617709.1 family 43 glycosylhydrolase [Brachybacterium sp. J153]
MPTNPPTAPRRRSILAAALAAPPLAMLAPSLAHAEGTSARQSFTPGEPWLDTDGKVIQAHGGQVVLSADAEGTLYYWFGEDRSNGYAATPGVHVYSSRDLYTWTDEGLALRTLTTADQIDTDPYFTALYGDYSEAQKSAVVRDLLTVPEAGSGIPAAILERPKVLHNAAKGTWVMWVHADGPSETSTAQYAKANAGVAVSDSPTGPYRWIDSYRLHHAPEGEPNWQPDNPGMARDMTVFLDDDGTAYIIYSSEENYSLFISRLDEDFTDLATPPDRAVKGVDFIRPYIGAHREAPALFKREGTYYLITSGATGWNPNPAQYATATEILGDWTDHGNPVTGDGASDTFRSQSTNVIPVDPERGTFVYMGDRWTPSDLKNAPYVWLPLRFGEGTQMSLVWADSWRWEDQPLQPAYTVDVALPSAVGLGEVNKLPRSGTLRLSDGTTEKRKITWEAQLDRPGMVEAVGTLSGPEGLTVRREVLVVPRHMVYLVNAGGAETSDYLALRKHAQGPALKNSVADQPYGADPATGAVWGYQGRSKPAGSETDSLDRSLRYATNHDDLTYRFANLPSGSFTVHVGYYDPWPWANRAARVTLNGTVVEEEQLFTGVPEAVAYSGIIPGSSGEIILTLHPTRSPDIQVSWVAVVAE